MTQPKLPAELLQQISDNLAIDVQHDWAEHTGGPYLRVSLLNLALASSDLRAFAMRSFFNKIVVTFELAPWFLRLPAISPHWTVPCRVLLLWLPVDAIPPHIHILLSHFVHLTSLAIVFPMAFGGEDSPTCTSADEWTSADGLHQLSMLPIAKQLLRLFVGIHGGVNCGAIDLDSLDLERFSSLTQLALSFDSTPVRGIIRHWTHIDCLWFSPNIMWQLAPYASAEKATVHALRLSFLDSSHILTNTNVRDRGKEFLHVDRLPRPLPSVDLDLLRSLWTGLQTLHLADFILDAVGLNILRDLSQLSRLDLHPSEWKVVEDVSPPVSTYSSNMTSFPLSDSLREDELPHVAVFIQTVLPRLTSLKVLHIGTYPTSDVERSRNLWASIYKMSPPKLDRIGLGVCPSSRNVGESVVHENHRHLSCTLCRSFGFDRAHGDVATSSSLFDTRQRHFDDHWACHHGPFHWSSTSDGSTHYESVLRQFHMEQLETPFFPYHVDSDGNYWSD